MCSLLEKEEIIFKKWDVRYPQEAIVRDGVVDFKTYQNEKIKIVFILKESNDFKDNLGFKKFLGDGAVTATWNNVTRWVEGIINNNEIFNWNSLSGISKCRRISALNKICVFNIKKTTGGSSTDYSELKDFAFHNSDLLREQFSFYAPDIVICCGTGDITKKYVLEQDDLSWKPTSNGVSYIEYKKRRYLIGFYHPQARFPHNMMYYTLMSACKELLKRS